MNRSLDAWVMTSPARAFAHAAAEHARGGLWVGLRRPLFVALTLGCAVSVIASGVLSLRLVLPATIYWAIVPITEALTLATVLWSRIRRVPVSRAIDLFFAGHGPWTLFLIAIAISLSSLHPKRGWALLYAVFVPALPLVLAWSMRIDYQYFRQVFGTGRAAAVRDVAVLRLLTWSAVFIIFAVPEMTPAAALHKLVEAVQEVTSR